MKRVITLFLVIAAVIISCENKAQNKTQISINDLIQNLKDSTNDDIIVISHRGDWRNAPENSLQAIKIVLRWAWIWWK